MNSEATTQAFPKLSEADLIDDLRLRLHGSIREERAARAEVRRMGRELALARRILSFSAGNAPLLQQPSRPVAAESPVPVEARRLDDKMHLHLDVCGPQAGHLAVTGWAFAKTVDWDCHLAAVTVLFRSGEQTYAALARRLSRPDVAAHFASQPAEESGGARRLSDAGFVCEVLPSSLPAGTDLNVIVRLECAGVIHERSASLAVRL